MRYIQPISALFISLVFSTSVFSQEQLGMRLSNYSGIHGTMFNPAVNVTSPLRWDINLIAAGAFVENNYIYFKDASGLRLLRNRTGFSFAGNQNDEFAQASKIEYDFTRGNRRKEMYTNVFVTGPSAMFHVKKHTFGIFFNARSVTSTNRIPSSLGYYDLDALQTGDVLHVKKFKIAGMAWSEIGLNYGRNLVNKKGHLLNGGISLKLLQGYEAFYFQNHEATDITIQDDFMTYDQANISFGIASGIEGYGGAAVPYAARVRGHGASVDIGAVYFMQTKSKKRPYDWKFGAALIDFGKISFSKNAQAHEVKTDQQFDFIQEQYEDQENFNDVFQLVSTQSSNDPNATFAGDHFGMWTPAAITVFADRAITNHFFINAAAVRRLRFRGAVPERENIWSLTPRFEHRWFEMSVPVVLYNDKDIRLGTAVRLGPLIIGSDNLTSWFVPQNLTGSDIYVALKINSFMLKKFSGGDKKNGFDPNECFDF